MKKILIIIGFLALFISCADATKKKDKENTEVTEKPMIALVDFDTKAGDFVDKEVQIKGIVDHVCKHGGKKLLLVNDEGDVHVDSETRFDDALVGDEITVNGVVTEFRVDEAFILQKEEDHIQNHKEGKDSKEVYDEKMEHLQAYRDQMKEEKADHLSFYSLDYISHEVIKAIKTEEEHEEGDHDHDKEGDQKDKE